MSRVAIETSGFPLSLAQLVKHLRTPLFRNAYALSVSAVASSGLGVLYWIVAAHLYKTEVVGLNSAAIAAMMFLSGVAGLYLDGVLLRFVPRAGSATGRLVGYAYLAIVIAAALVAAGYLVGINFWSPALGFLVSGPWWIGGFIFATIMWSVFGLQDAALTGMRQTLVVPVENTIFAAAKIVLLVLLARVSPEYGIFASWTLPAVFLIVPVNYLVFGRYIPRHSELTRERADPVEARQVVKYLAGNYVGFLFLISYIRLLPVMVIQVAGSAASAFFYLPWVITGSLQAVAWSMSMSLIVEGANDPTRLGSLARRAIIHTLRLLGPVIAVLVVGAPFILNIFGKGYSNEGADLLRLLALGLLPNVIIVLYVGLSRVRQRIRRVIAVQAVLAIFVLGVGYVLLTRWGITGAGVAWLVGQSIVAVILLATELRPLLGAARKSVTRQPDPA